MRKIPYLLIVCSLVIFTGCNKPVKVLLVLGGHAFDTTEFFMALEGLENLEFDPVYYPLAIKQLKALEADTYDVLLFYDYNPELPLADSSVFTGLTDKGIPILFMHHAICTFQKWEGYKEMVGGKYVMPGTGADSAEYSTYKHDLDLKVNIVDPKHPLTAGMQEFTIHDEGYANLLTEADIIPLLSTDHPDSYPLVGWTHVHKHSTIVYLMLGHDKMAYANPAYTRLLKQSIFWLAENKTTHRK